MCDLDRKAQDLLEQRLKSGVLSHAYLLTAPREEIATKYALEFSKSLLCREKNGKACGDCEACRKFETGSMPDFLHVMPENGVIPIDVVRKLTAATMLRPLEGEVKVILIEGAQYMRQEAANALLKTLEEPPDYIVFLLTARRREQLLPTVVSRCQIISLGFSEEGETLVDRTRLFRILGDVLDGKKIQAFINKDFFEEYKDEKDELLTQIESFFQDVLTVVVTGETSRVRNKEHLAKIRKYGSMDFRHLERILNETARMRRDFKVNANFTLAVESLLLLIGGIE